MINVFTCNTLSICHINQLKKSIYIVVFIEVTKLANNNGQRIHKKTTSDTKFRKISIKCNKVNSRHLYKLETMQ